MKKSNLTLKSIKDLAESKNKKILYNRQLGGYQVRGYEFDFSEIVYPLRNEKGKLELSNQDLTTLKSYI